MGVMTGANVHRLKINEHFISWKWTPLVMGLFKYKQVHSVKIPIKHILNVKKHEFLRGYSSNIKQTKLIIRCVQKLGSGLWKLQTLDVPCSPWEIEFFCYHVEHYLELNGQNRPRSLLVFINPYCGKRRAEVIFYSVVLPIFNFAGIRTKVIITTHQGHCQNFILTEDLGSYDGVVAVGGDGLFSELIHGLLYRTRVEAGFPFSKQHKPFSTELSPRLRIGLIPAGSTNAVNWSLHGTEDIETAAIHIVMGHDVGVDVLSIHDASTEEFLRYTVSLLGYGFHGDIIGPSERLRWLGPPRYDVVGALKWLQLASYQCRISYLPSTTSTPFDGGVCGIACPVCHQRDGQQEKTGRIGRANRSLAWNEVEEAPRSSFQSRLRLCRQSLDACSVHPGSEVERDLLMETTENEFGVEKQEDEEGKAESGWRVLTGDFVAVNAFLISCRCAKSPLGPAPAAHLGDGFLDLILVRRCSRLQYLSYLTKLTNRRIERRAQHLCMPFVEAYRVRAFRFEAINRGNEPLDIANTVAHNASVWCADGEVIRNPDIICCVHRQLLSMYGGGPDK